MDANGELFESARRRQEELGGRISSWNWLSEATASASQPMDVQRQQ
jgi:hypothetical protein